jgi:hypothetical protein
VTLDVADDAFVASVNYSPLTARSDVVESLLPFWLDTAEMAAARGGVVPDEEISLTVWHSVPEIVSAPFRAPRGR